MAVITVRLNKDDKSSLIRKIIQEKYEDLQDMKLIENFEQNSDDTFFSFEEIMSDVK